MAIKTGIDPLDEYCEAVKSGEKDVCKWVKLAVDRHYRDLERQRTDDFPYYFEPKACMHYVNFFRDHLTHFDGIFSGKPITFEPWQYFTWGSPFGWLRTERVMDMPIRRFNEVIVIIPKKQGKSIVAAGTVLYLIYWDDYPGAQVYMLANNREQVKGLAYRDAEVMVEKSAELEELFKVNHSAGDRGIYCPVMNSHVKPQTSDPETTDGLKVHGVVNDEIKDWTKFKIYDTFADGTSTDPNSFIMNITTAGDRIESLGYERQRYLEKILEQSIDDEKTFGVIYGIDKGDEDEWDSLELAKKANPNFGVSVSEDYYKGRIKKARQSKRSKAAYMTKQLNDWGHSSSGWLDMARWDSCGDSELKIEDVAHYPCIMTIDMAAKFDLTVIHLTFFDSYDFENVNFYTFADFYVPEMRLRKTDDQHSDAYSEQLNEWAGQWVTVSGEEVIDYADIKRDIQKYCRTYQVDKVAFDPHNFEQMRQDLISEMGLSDRQAEKLFLQINQNAYKSFDNPIKEVEALVLQKRLNHDNNPVLRWCIGNTRIKETTYGYLKWDKPVQGEKIDGAVTLIMAIATHIYAVEDHGSGISPAAQRAMAKLKKAGA